MAKFTIATDAAEPVRPYLEGVAKSLVERIYGKDGPAWGTKLSDLEDTILALRQVLSEKMLAEALERQARAAAQRPEAFCRCPQCGRDVAERPQQDPAPDDASRRVQTRAGQAQWPEPVSYCRKCRRSFFPSEQKSGD